MKHEMQHPESPTWCIHCGTFDMYCQPDGDCDAEQKGSFDSRSPFIANRMFKALFGLSLPGQRDPA